MDHGIGLALKRSLDVIGTVENISFSDELEQCTLVLITYQSRRSNLQWHRCMLTFFFLKGYADIPNTE